MRVICFAEAVDRKDNSSTVGGVPTDRRRELRRQVGENVPARDHLPRILEILLKEDDRQDDDPPDDPPKGGEWLPLDVRADFVPDPGRFKGTMETLEKVIRAILRILIDKGDEAGTVELSIKQLRLLWRTYGIGTPSTDMLVEAKRTAVHRGWIKVETHSAHQLPDRMTITLKGRLHAG